MSTRNGGSQKKNGVRRNKICLMRRGGLPYASCSCVPDFPVVLPLVEFLSIARSAPSALHLFASLLLIISFPSVYFFSPFTNTYPPQSLLSLVSPSAYRHSYSARIRSAPVASYRLFRPVSHPTYPSDQKLIRPQALFVRKRHQSTNACTWTPIHFIIAFHVPLLLSYSTTPVLNTRTGKSSKYTF